MATWAVFGMVIVLLPVTVPEIVATLPVRAPITASLKPTLVNDLIPNLVVLPMPAVTQPGLPWAAVRHVNAVVDTLPTGVPLADELAPVTGFTAVTTGVPVAKICPI
jgi:hypothetical protein